jgi:CubicO group peptidase (beta-lactamase class C family)
MIITKVTKLKREGSYGYTLGNQSLQLTSRDSAKIGYLYLNDGRWGKKQILSPEWVSEATRTQIDVPGKDWDYGYL